MAENLSPDRPLTVAQVWTIRRMFPAYRERNYCGRFSLSGTMCRRRSWHQGGCWFDPEAD